MASVSVADFLCKLAARARVRLFNLKLSSTVECGSYEWAILVRTDTVNSGLLYPLAKYVN